jgi:hypothetical protein
MSDYESDYMSDEELDLSYEDIETTRRVYDTIKFMSKGTELFQYLTEDDLYDFLYPQEEE